MSADLHAAPLALRLWAYQAERFPLLQHGPAIATFASAGVLLPALLEGRLDALDPWSVITAIVVSILFFAQLRIADEHKDFEDDSRFRPERAVPRGLVRLGELRLVAFAAAAVQVALVWRLAPELLAPLALVWGWMAAMTVEFLAPRTLKARPGLYLVSHMVITPLIALFALACGWIGIGATPAFGVAHAAFLALAFTNGVAIEVSRKTWARDDERLGVESYSKLWGNAGAAATTIAAVLVGAALVLFIQQGAEIAVGFQVASAAFAALAIVAGALYARTPTRRNAKLLAAGAALWVVGGYLLVGLGPAAARVLIQ
jgi:4-hydroxybenzoate polyprenyltransferase